MVDLSPYLEDATPQKETETGGPVPLTEEEKERVFFDFDKHPEFMGKFNGPGQTYLVGKDVTLNTWSFTDINDLNWLIPQWHVMNEPQGSFKGFQNEEPGQYMYYIKYLGKKQDNGLNKHDLSILRRKI